VAAENRGGGAGWVWCSGVGRSVSGSEREEIMVAPEFYKNRERGKGKRKGAASGGLAIGGC
jgi:hypothetical protein